MRDPPVGVLDLESLSDDAVDRDDRDRVDGAEEREANVDEGSNREVR